MRFTIQRFQGFWRQFRRSKRGLTGLGIIVFFSALAIFAPLIAPYAPMDPKMDVGKYPALGPLSGPKIAERLSYPSWYHYLPLPRGPREIQETFHTSLNEAGGRIFQLFGRIGEQPLDDRIRLQDRCIESPLVQVTFPNLTTRELKIPNEAYWTSKKPGEVTVPVLLPKETNITVTYTTGIDLTDNLQIVPDLAFSRNPFEQGSWGSDSESEVFDISYDSDEGYNSDGCIKIVYSPQQVETESKRAVVFLSFEYPYWEPPKSFWGHISFFTKGMPEARVNITVTCQKDQGELIQVIKLVSGPLAYYSSLPISSTSEIVRNTIGSPTPEKALFPAPGNYTVAIEAVFNSNQTTTLLLDNFNIILYGNTFGLLGTDNASPFPRDIFSSLVYGTQVSLVVGVLSALFGTFIGLFLGLVSGYVGGIVDETIMRIGDLFLVLPTLPLFIILVVALQQVYGSVSMWNIIIVLTLFGWMGFARSVRSMVLSLRERPFIEAARAAGAKRFYIINRHVLPNVFALVYITLATSVPGAIVTEASLSWLGLGDPKLASWGKLLYDFQSSGIVTTRGLTDYWFWMFPASLSIALLATAFILIGYALDDILNPRLRQRR